MRLLAPHSGADLQMGKVRWRVDFLSLAWGLTLDSVSTSESELAFELVSALELALGSVSTLVSALESMLALGKASRSEGESSRVLRRSELLRRDRIAVLYCRHCRRRRC